MQIGTLTNPSTSSRTATITVNAGNAPARTVTVTQAGQNPANMPNIITPTENQTIPRVGNNWATWDFIPGAIGYYYSLINVTTGIAIVNRQWLGPQTNWRSISVGNHEVGNRFRIEVSKVDSNWNEHMAVRHFNVEPVAPTITPPNITTPPHNSPPLPRQTFDAIWQTVTNATSYLVSLRNLTTNELIYDRVSVGNALSFRINQFRLTYGHQYRLAVASVAPGQERWSEREFSVQGAAPIIPTGVSISPSGPISLNIGQTQQLTATVLPANATDRRVTWSSGNSAVATVNANGLVTAHAAGTANITVTTVSGGRTASVTIVVLEPITLSHNSWAAPAAGGAKPSAITVTVNPPGTAWHIQLPAGSVDSLHYLPLPNEADPILPDGLMMGEDGLLQVDHSWLSVERPNNGRFLELSADPNPLPAVRITYFYVVITGNTSIRERVNINQQGNPFVDVPAGTLDNRIFRIRNLNGNYLNAGSQHVINQSTGINSERATDLWHFTPIGNGFFHLESLGVRGPDLGATHLVLGAMAGNNLSLQVPTGHENQQWSIRMISGGSQPTYYFFNRANPQLMINAFGVASVRLHTDTAGSGWTLEEYTRTASWDGRYTRFPVPGTPVVLDINVRGSALVGDMLTPELYQLGNVWNGITPNVTVNILIDAQSGAWPNFNAFNVEVVGREFDPTPRGVWLGRFAANGVEEYCAIIYNSNWTHGIIEMSINTEPGSLLTLPLIEREVTFIHEVGHALKLRHPHDVHGHNWRPISIMNQCSPVSHMVEHPGTMSARPSRYDEFNLIQKWGR